ncbi:MAG: glycosyl hydrolase family 18 protein [Methylomonas sp.]|nr:glycosyl hydrolase family 18 protein [Methylomonas sp.]
MRLSGKHKTNSKLGFSILLLSLGISGATQAQTPPADPAPGKWVTAFYPGYQQALLPPEEIDFSVLTHLVVGLLFPNSDGSLNPMFMMDPVAGEAFAKNAVDRAHAAGKKALLMLGGAGAYGFTSAVSEPNRARLVENAVAYAKRLGFDGIDVDYEEGIVDHYDLALQFVTELRAVWPEGIIAFDSFWINNNFSSEINPHLIEIAKQVDQFNLMTYYMADAWGWKSWHSSALDGNQPEFPTSVKSSVDAFVNRGVPAAKIGMGIGSFGTCWGAPVTGPRQDTGGSYVRASDNAMSYPNIRNSYFAAKNYFYDMDADAPYLSFSTPTGQDQCGFISYENPRSIAAKGAYARAKGLGGTIVWTLAEGYERGSAKPNEFLYAVRDAFLSEHGDNREPVADAYLNRVAGNTPLTATFNASLSSDPDGDKLSFAWDFGDGGYGDGQEVRHTFTNTSASVKTYRVLLTVSDGQSSASKELSVQVNPPGLVQVDAPSGLTGKVSGLAVRLRWNDNADNEDLFAIERAPYGSNDFVKVGEAAPNATAHTDAPPAGHYHYRVRAYNAAANKYSDPSNSVEIVATGIPTADLPL